MTNGLEHLSYEERLRVPGLFNLDLAIDTIAVLFYAFKGSELEQVNLSITSLVTAQNLTVLAYLNIGVPFR